MQSPGFETEEIGERRQRGLRLLAVFAIVGAARFVQQHCDRDLQLPALVGRRGTNVPLRAVKHAPDCLQHDGRHYRIRLQPSAAARGSHSASCGQYDRIAIITSMVITKGAAPMITSSILPRLRRPCTT